MDNVHNKHYFFEVYSSKEEIDDINELQDKYEYESISSKEEYSLFGIEAGDINFGLKKTKVRLYIEPSSLTSSLVYVTSLCNEYNHFIVEKENLISNRHLGPEILEEIEFLINIGCEAGPIILTLQKYFPETVIHPKYVYNAICRIQNSQNKSKTDAAETFEKLMKLQREEYGWFVKVRLEDNLALNILFTDADLTIVSAIYETLPSTKHNYCIWHFCKNLDKNLRAGHYVTPVDYLMRESSLLNMLKSLLNKEQQFERHEQSNQNPTVGLPNVVRRYFKRIDAIIKKFLTPLENWKDLLENKIVKQDEDGEDGKEQQSDDENNLTIKNNPMMKNNPMKNKGDDEEQSDVEQGDDEEQSEKLNFPEDDYELPISNLYALITYLNHANIHAMFHIGLIPDRWYNEKFFDFQEEPAITIFSEKNTVKPILLHEVRHTQAFLETVKQNLSYQAKYNQGFSYAKKAIGLALEIDCEDELNNMLQRWIREKKNETSFRQLEINKEICRILATLIRR
ncbi:15424_t:CDS:10, partial [Funneliformis mosseae]